MKKKRDNIKKKVSNLNCKKRAKDLKEQRAKDLKEQEH